MNEHPLWFPNFETKRVTRKTALKLLTAGITAPFVLPNTDALAQSIIDYNKCDYSESYPVPFGIRSIAYCEENGEYKLVLSNQLPDQIKRGTERTGNRVHSFHDEFSDKNANLAGRLSIYYDAQTEKVLALWGAGTITEAFGFYRTDWFDLNVFRNIHLVQNQWVNNQLVPMIFSNRQDQLIKLDQQFIPERKRVPQITPEDTPPQIPSILARLMTRRSR